MKRPLEGETDASDRNPIVFLDVAIGPQKVGRVVLELFKDGVPRTVENFRALCTGERGVGLNGKKLHYKGSIFHKVMPQFMVQGGDIINFDGTGGESIYGPHFEDESFEMKHNKAGLLSMVNEGHPNTNSSQFIITTVPCSHLDETHVVFGQVLKGIGAIVELGQVDTENDVPKEKLSIIDCGELRRGESWGIEENDGTADVFPPWPEDWDHPLAPEKLDHVYIENVIKKIKDSGNHYFSKSHFVDAGRKYKKSLRYIDWMMTLKDLPDEWDKSKTMDLKMVTLLNLAAVELKQREYRAALAVCNTVLQFDGHNSKALFRRGQAHMGLNEYQMALGDLQQALEEMPNNKDIIQEIQKVKRTIQSYLVVEKKACQKMFK